MIRPTLTPLRRYRRQVLTVLLIGAASKFAFAQWNVEPVDLEGNAGWTLFIDVDPLGRPAASYFTTSPNGYHRYSTRSGGGWQEQEEIEFNDAFRFDNNGAAHFFSTPGPSFYPTLTADGAGAPVYTTPVESVRIANGQILGFNDQNHPRVAYIDTSRRTLRYAEWDGTAWSGEDVASTDSFQFGNSYFIGALDEDGGAHFVFPDGDSLFDVPITYAAPNGTGWTESFVSATNGSPHGIDIDAAGRPHITFEPPSGTLQYASFNGSTWDARPVTGMLANFGFDSDLVLDDDDQPHVFLRDNQFAGAEFIKHFYLDDNAWEQETIDTWNDSSSGPEAIDAIYEAGRFHVLFATGNKEIFYASTGEPPVGLPETVEIAPTFDVVYFPGLTPTLTDGASSVLVGGIPGSDQLPQQEAILEFPLDVVPKGADITSVRLQLDPFGSSGQPRIEVIAYAGDGLASLSDGVDPGSLAAITAPTSVSTGADFALDAALIESLRDAGDHLGLRLASLDLPEYITFSTAEAAFGDPPRLVIDYVVNGVGDNDGDGDQDGADFVGWQRGESVTPLSSTDLDAWAAQFGGQNHSAAATAGVIPEPSTILLLSAAVFCLSPSMRNNSSLTSCISGSRRLP